MLYAIIGFLVSVVVVLWARQRAFKKLSDIQRDLIDSQRKNIEVKDQLINTLTTGIEKREEFINVQERLIKKMTSLLGIPSPPDVS